MNCALVTGSSRGIGHAVARALMDDGWNVVGIARGPEPPELRASNYRHVRLDLSDPQALETWLRDDRKLEDAALAGERFGLVNNAGSLQPMCLLPDASAAALQEAFAINAIAPMLLSGFAVRTWAARVAIRIVDISSGAADSPYPGWGAYCSTKAALAMAGRVLASEVVQVDRLQARDVAVLSFAPGVVDTAMQTSIRASDVRDFPDREKFRDLHARDALIQPAAPAREIADWLGAPKPRAAHETRRFGG